MIKIENVSYVYSEGTPFEKVAVKNISLNIEKGEFLGVIGHTGSGKSTLISHLNGLVKPTSGKVFIDGEDIWQDPKTISKYRFKVGLVFQYPEYQLFEETVYKDISFGPKNMGLSPEEIDKRVREACRYVDIREEAFEKSPFELSGGQKRRVAIAGVIAMDPSILIFDEPTAGLDPKGRNKILDLISSYQKQSGKTIIFVSHSMDDISKYAKKVLVLNEGEVFLYDTTQEVFSHASELVEIGLDVPQINSVFLKLKQENIGVNENIYTVNQAKEYILKAVKGVNP